jgi:hypothetical protein
MISRNRCSWLEEIEIRCVPEVLGRGRVLVLAWLAACTGSVGPGLMSVWRSRVSEAGIGSLRMIN